MCPGQTPRGRFGPPAGSPLPPASPSTLLLKISGEGKQTGWVGAHPPRSGSPFREAKLYFLACCFYNLPTLKIKSLPLPSIGLRLPFLPTPQAARPGPGTASRCWGWGPSGSGLCLLPLGRLPPPCHLSRPSSCSLQAPFRKADSLLAGASNTSSSSPRNGSGSSGSSSTVGQRSRVTSHPRRLPSPHV